LPRLWIVSGAELGFKNMEDERRGMLIHPERCFNPYFYTYGNVY
jgi:hypothetical protein